MSRMRWARYVAHMGHRHRAKFLVRRPEEKRPLGKKKAQMGGQY
jgi:hypothetical protein